MTTAHPTYHTTARNGGPTSKAAEHARNRCLRCDNTGSLIEWRISWRTPRPGDPPEKHSRRVGSEEEGIERMHELLDQAEAQPGSVFEVEIVSGARDCSCRQPAKPAQSSSTEPTPVATAPATEGTAPQQYGLNPKRTPVIDRKMAQAGDRES